MTTANDSELAAFTSRRDESSFRTLYRAHTPAAYALAMRLTGGSGTDSEELVQEAWVRAVETLDAFGRRSAFRTWLSGIVVNCYRELVRQRSRGPRSLQEAGVEAAAEQRALASAGTPIAPPADVERAIARLADGYREVLVLFDLNGYTHQEIGRLLGISEGTSKSQLSRARRRLRELLLADGPKARQREKR